MKKFLYLFFMIIFLPGCKFFSSKNKNTIEVGSLASNNIWIYLSGLSKEFDSTQELENRKILDQIGKKLNIKFIAIKPENRCAEFDNKLCWPHNSSEETLKTYNYILNITKNINISGLIGFSNGGFFLNKLAQLVELNKPLISIGSAGYLEDTNLKNNIYLLIGKQDTYHYAGATEFYNKSTKTPLNVKLIEHDGSHEIPEEILEAVLKNI